MKSRTIVIICICIVLISSLMIGTFVISYNNSLLSEDELLTLHPISVIGLDNYNAQFDEYEGFQIGSTVNALISKVMYNNTNMDNKIKIEYIPISGKKIEATEVEQVLKKIMKNIKIKERYDVWIEEYNEDGTISIIEITQKADMDRVGLFSSSDVISALGGYNGQFLGLCGEKETYRSALLLISKVINSNIENSYKVKVNFDSNISGDEIISTKNEQELLKIQNIILEYKNEKIYDIYCSEYTAGGKVKEITITQKDE